MLTLTLEAMVKIALLLGCMLGAAAYLVLVERWIAAWIQDRLGPNRVGIPLTKIRLFGLGQPIADGTKFICKEEATPGSVDRALYFLAPLIMFTAAAATMAVVPFGSVLPPEASLDDRPIQLVVAPGVDVAAVYVMAIGGIGIVGAMLSGWASNNKYSLFGGLRSAAQLISYELPLGLAVLGVVLVTGSLRFDAIIGQQAASGVWNAAVQPLGLLVFFVAGFAESGRLPFDLAEAEQELVSGYHTEYGGMKLMVILVTEYFHMFIASFLIVILFFGGWHLWGVTGGGQETTWATAALRVIVLLGKVLVTILFFMVSRWSWSRFRFDQLMAMTWQTLVPLGMVNLVAMAVWVEFGPRWAAALGWPTQLAMAALGWGVLVVASTVLLRIAPALCDNSPYCELPEEADA